ncbi:MAG TPA: MFS transporter [Clostridia bacterium]|nr:MFS transporter [Clostridia bacterium]
MHGKSDKAFLLFLAGQGILNLGESIRFIAVTVLIYKLTGSGLSAAAGAATAALPSIIGSPFSGVLGDRANESRILILIDILRFFTVPLFLYAHRVSFIYLILIVISVLDVIYGPSRKKFVLALTGKNKAIEANSRLVGVSGAAYLAGPMLAGILTDIHGPAPVITAAALCCLISCGMTIMTVITSRNGSKKCWSGQAADYRPVGANDRGSGGACAKRSIGGKRETYLKQLMGGINYSKRTPFIGELLAIGLITGFCAISINLSFYPYAFDVLAVTAKGWSLMITIYYGTNLLAMLLVGYLEGRNKKNGRVMAAGGLFYFCLALMAVIWFQYAYVRSYPAVLLLQFTEGTAAAVCGILLAARYQKLTDNRFMARVSGIGDIFGSLGRLAGMGCTAMITKCFRFGDVFTVNGILLLLFVLVSLTRSVWLRGDQ